MDNQYVLAIKGFPTELRNKLKTLAASEGESLRDLVIRLLTKGLK